MDTETPNDSGSAKNPENSPGTIHSADIANLSGSLTDSKDSSVRNTAEDIKPLQAKKGIPIKLVVILLVLSFIIGAVSTVWFFQNKLTVESLQGNVQKNDNVQIVPDILIIGTDPTAPPMESINENGVLVGYDIDLGYKIAEALGVKAEFNTIPWDEVFTALEDGRVDLIISSVTITDERKLKYNFSTPYINAGQIIVSRTEKPITSVKDLKGKRISVQKDTTNEKEAFKFTDAALVLSYNGFEDAAKALSEGKSDAMISDLTLAKGFISQYDNLKITSDPFTNDFYGVVLRKNDTELKIKLDEVITRFSANGILTDLRREWLE